MCEYCKISYKLITQLHLSTKHNSNIAKYQKQFPKAKIRPDYNCENCDVLVTHRKSSRAKYCPDCAVKINKLNVLYNVRKHNAKRKKYLERSFTIANLEHGIQVDEVKERGVTRVSPTHSAWDFVPNGQDVKGTVSERDLTPNKEGRIPAAIRLRKQIQYIKDRGKR